MSKEDYQSQIEKVKKRSIDILDFLGKEHPRINYFDKDTEEIYNSWNKRWYSSWKLNIINTTGCIEDKEKKEREYDSSLKIYFGNWFKKKLVFEEIDEENFVFKKGKWQGLLEKLCKNIKESKEISDKKKIGYPYPYMGLVGQ